MKMYGAFQRLRLRFIEHFDNGLLLFPATSLESQNLDNAVRSAIHIFGNPREESILPEDFARAVILVQKELDAVQWIIRNPHYATDLAERSLLKLTGLLVKK